ncbi:MAG: ABC transporter substrate-binding protein, partial [Flavobacteriaceae bacterium]|nr:ABC transporter substrate-binding protein [Flavobacteriaceae bacterium]
NNTFRRLGDCPTPWPCFVIAVRDEVLENNPEEIKEILNTINTQTRNFKETQGIDKVLANRYKQQLEDIQQWLSITEWESKNPISEELIDEIQNKMQTFGVIDSTANAGKFIKNMYI